MANRNVDNLIQGAGNLYIAATSATEPSDAEIHDAPDSATWTDLGFTQDGVTLTVVQEYSELEVDQLVDMPGRRLVSRDFTIATNLAEPTLENLNYVLNGEGTWTEDNTSAGATASATDNFEPSIDPSNAPTYHAVIFDGFAPSGLRRRVIVRKVLNVNDVEFAYEKDGQSVFSVEFGAHYVSTSVAPFRVVDQTAEPTG